MSVKQLSNGQIEVTENNLQLIHSNINGMRFNECFIKTETGCEMVGSHDPRFNALFIALVNYKNSI